MLQRIIFQTISVKARTVRCSEGRSEADTGMCASLQMLGQRGQRFALDCLFSSDQIVE